MSAEVVARERAPGAAAAGGAAMAGRARALCCRSLALLLVALLVVAPARAEEPGVIAGRLVNGTTGGASPAGTAVVLYTFRGDADQAERPTPTDARGAFRFDGLAVGEDLTYGLTATYAGVTYTTELIHLTTASTTRTLELTVYEATATDPGLRVPRALLVFGDIDAERQEIAAMEILTLANPADRTFTPTPEGPAGPMGLVRFGLPPGARDLRPLRGLDPAGVIQIDRGFGSLAPVPPGENELAFSYRFPYPGERHALEKSLPYGAALVQVLVPEGGPDVASAGLRPTEPVELGGRRFRVWIGRDLEPGTRLALELRGLPTRPLWRAARDVVARPVAVGALFALVLAVGVAWAWRSRPRPRAAPAAAPEALVQALADLDDALAAGELDELAHRERRAALKARLRAQRLADDVSPPATPGEARRG